MTSKQQLKIKSSVVDTNNCLNGIFPICNLLNSEFSSGSRLADTFSSWYSFHQANCKDKKSKATYFCNLDDSIVFNVSSNLSSVIVISDTSIKNDVTTFIVHVHSYLNSIKKTLYQNISITSIEAELFAIRYGILNFWFNCPSLSTTINCHIKRL